MQMGNGQWGVARDMHRRGQEMPLWAMLIGVTAVWLDALANYFLLYTYVWWWDRFTHAFGGFALTIVGGQLWAARVAGVGGAGNWFRAKLFHDLFLHFRRKLSDVLNG